MEGNSRNMASDKEFRLCGLRSELQFTLCHWVDGLCLQDLISDNFN